LAVAHDFDVCPPEEFYRTTYYGDYLRPHRLHGNFTAQAYGRDGNAYRLVATTLDHPSPAVLAHGRAVLALLQPAFAAGIAALERATAAPGALGRVLDQLAEPTLVCDRRGRTVHQNPALDAVLAEVRTHSGAAAEDVLRREFGALASGLGALLGRNGGLRDGAPPPAAVREVQVGAHRLRARACFTGEDTLAREALVWVTIERVGRSDRAGAPVPARPDHGGDAVEHDAALRVRHSLTAQELAVARLMAERRTDAEIGRALGISPNTARTHAERVRRKLGVARRTEVAAALGHG
jgi:DNA-binding CsgD family transcriptional regulator